MAGPITWRSINGPSMADASRPLMAAQQSFNGGFDALNNVLKQREAMEQANWTQQQEAAKQGYLNDLHAFDNVDALAQQRQTFQERLKRLTPEQQAAVRGQFDQRVSALRDQTLAANDYRNKMQLQEFSPQLDRIRAEIARGNEEGVARDIAALPERFRAELFKSADERGQTELKRANDAVRFKWDEDAQKWAAELRPLDKQAKEASIAASRASVASANESMLTNRLRRQQMETEAQRAKLDAQGRELFANTAFSMGTLDTPEGQAAVDAGIDKAVIDPKDRARVREGIADFAKANPGEPIPVARVLQYVAEHGNDWGWGQDNDLKASLVSLNKDGQYVKEKGAYLQYRANRVAPFAGGTPSSGNTQGELTEPEKDYEAAVKAALAEAAAQGAAQRQPAPVPFNPLRVHFNGVFPKR